jgi:arylsulfatase A-like enzyme
MFGFANRVKKLLAQWNLRRGLRRLTGALSTGRLRRLGWAGAVFVAALLGQASLARAATPKPNVVLFVVDDLGWTDTSATGSNFYETPNVQRLQRISLNFRNGYAACPVCSPTRASLLLGLSPARTRVTNWLGSGQTGGGDRPLTDPAWADQIPAARHTLAEALASAGYSTAHVGKWHLGERNTPGADPLANGFGTNIGGNDRGSPPPDSDRDHRYFADETGAFNAPSLGANGKEGQFLPERLSEEAAAYVQAEAGDGDDQPFFLHMSHFAVHTPIGAPAERIEYYREKRSGAAPAGGWTHNDATYAALVEGMDKSLGTLLDTLEQTKDEEGDALIDKTVILFVSDNGGLTRHTDNGPLREGKGSSYEGGIRVPMMLYAPGMATAGQNCDRPVITDDAYETVMDLTGLENPNAITDGVSLAALLDDPGADLGRSSIHWHYPHYSNQFPNSGGAPFSAVRRGDWKAIYFYEEGHWELYNLANDLGETANLADDRPDMLRLLSGDLVDWLEATDAQMPRSTNTGLPVAPPEVVPEPAGASVMLIGLGGLLRRRRRFTVGPRS